MRVLKKEKDKVKSVPRNAFVSNVDLKYIIYVFYNIRFLCVYDACTRIHGQPWTTKISQLWRACYVRAHLSRRKYTYFADRNIPESPKIYIRVCYYNTYIITERFQKIIILRTGSRFNLYIYIVLIIMLCSSSTFRVSRPPETGVKHCRDTPHNLIKKNYEGWCFLHSDYFDHDENKDLGPNWNVYVIR